MARKSRVSKDRFLDILGRHVKRDRVWKPVEVLRRKPQLPHLVCGFSVCASSFGGSNGKARALPVLVRASRSSNPFELPPSFGSGCGGCCKTEVLGGHTWLNLHPPQRSQALDPLPPTPHPPTSTTSPCKPATTPTTSTT